MFNTVKFLDQNFGHADAIIGLAAKYDVDVPEKDTVRKWLQRGSVSSEWLPVLIYLVECAGGQPVSLEPYYERTGEDHDIFA